MTQTTTANMHCFASIFIQHIFRIGFLEAYHWRRWLTNILVSAAQGKIFSHFLLCTNNSILQLKAESRNQNCLSEVEYLYKKCKNCQQQIISHLVRLTVALLLSYILSENFHLNRANPIERIPHPLHSSDSAEVHPKLHYERGGRRSQRGLHGNKSGGARSVRVPLSPRSTAPAYTLTSTVVGVE